MAASSSKLYLFINFLWQHHLLVQHCRQSQPKRCGSINGRTRLMLRSTVLSPVYRCLNGQMKTIFLAAFLYGKRLQLLMAVSIHREGLTSSCMCEYLPWLSLVVSIVQGYCQLWVFPFLCQLVSPSEHDGSICTRLLFALGLACRYLIITFRVSRRWRKMYCGLACLCVCLYVCVSVYRTDPDVTWGSGRECP